jgi:hypothetical protein
MGFLVPVVALAGILLLAVGENAMLATPTVRS